MQNSDDLAPTDPWRGFGPPDGMPDHLPSRLPLGAAYDNIMDDILQELRNSNAQDNRDFEEYVARNAAACERGMAILREMDPTQQASDKLQTGANFPLMQSHRSPSAPPSTTDSDRALRFYDITPIVVKAFSGHPRTQWMNSRLPSEVMESVQRTCLVVHERHPNDGLMRAESLYRCAHQEATNGQVYWTVSEERFFACQTCFNAQRVCFRYYNPHRCWIALPLPVEFWPHPQLDASNPRYFIRDEATRKSHSSKGVWNSVASKAVDYNNYGS